MTTLLAPIAEQNVGPAPGVDDDVEPDRQWKEALRARIERELQSSVDKVRQERDAALRGTWEGTREYEAAMRAYRMSMDRVRRIAEDQFSQELKIARFERSLALGKEMEGEEFAAFRRQQQAIWDRIKQDGAERPQGHQDGSVVGGPTHENGDPVAVPPRASGEHDAREGPSVLYRDSRPLARAPAPEYRPRDRTQSGSSDQIGGVPGSYGSRPARSRGNSSVLAADFELPSSPGPSPYDQSSIGRQGLSSLSRTRPQDIWLPSPSPKDNAPPTSRAFAHATAPGISPISPGVREGPVNDAGGRTVSRAGSIRSNERPSPITDLDPGSSLPRDRFGMGSVEERMSSRKGKEPDRPEQPPPQQSTIYDYYVGGRRPESRTTMPITPVRPALLTQSSEDHYFYQPSPARPRADSDDRDGIPVRKRSSRSSRRSIPSDQGSPENPRYMPAGPASARPIPNKRSFNGEYDWQSQPSAPPRPIYGPQSPPVPYPTTSNSRPIPRPPTNEDGPRRHSPSGPWYGSQSPPDALPFAGYDLPFSSSSPRHRYTTSSSMGSAGGGAGGGSGRRNSNGSRSVRSRSSRQEFWGPADVSQQPLATYEEQSVASDSDSEEDYGMDLDDLWRVRERQELSWKLIREQEEAKRQDVLRRAEEAKRLQEEARRKEEEARKKEEEARRQAEEARRKEEEVKLRALEIQQKEEELRRREAELAKREMEAKLAEERRKREEAEARLEEEKRKRLQAEEDAVRREQEEARRRAREEAERRELEEAERRRQEREDAERARRERDEAERRERERRERERKEKEEKQKQAREQAERREREREERERWEREERAKWAREDSERRAREERERREREEQERARREEEERERREKEERDRQRREDEKKAREQREREESRQRQLAAEAEARREAERLQAQRAAAERLEADRQQKEAAMAAEAEARAQAQIEARARAEARAQAEAQAQADARARADEARARAVEAARLREVEEATRRREAEEATRQREAEEATRQREAEEARRREAEAASRADDTAPQSQPDLSEDLQDPELIRQQELIFQQIEAQRRAKEEGLRRAEESRKRAAEDEQRKQAEQEGLRKELEARRRVEEERRRKEEEHRKREEALLSNVLRQSEEEHRRYEEQRRRQDSVGSSSDTGRAGGYSSASSSAPRPVPTQASSIYSGAPPGDRSSTASSSSYSSSASFFSAASGRSTSTGYSTSSSRSTATPVPNATPTSTPSAASSGTAKGAWKSSSFSQAGTSPTTPSRSNTGSTYRTAYGGPTAPHTPSTPSHSRPAASQSVPIPSEEEWARRQEEHARKQFEQFQRDQQAQQRRQEAKAMKQLSKEEVIKLFEEHERRWARLASMDVLSWHSFPWPMLKPPSDPEQLTFPEVQAYVLSPHQQGDKTPKERIKDYLRKWHPDRFETKVLPKVREEEREKVQEGAGTVARHLNKLLSNLSGSAENGLFG